MATTRYTDGEYLLQNPTWHVEDAPWKVEQILAMLRRHDLAPRSVCEVGCGAGEILARLQRRLPDDCELAGYDISPQALRLASTRSNPRLQYHLGDLVDTPGPAFELVLAIDLIEHLDDYHGFLRRLKPRGEWKLFHIPLDLSAYAVLRSHPMLDLRTSVGHIHYFTKDLALAVLGDLDYEVVDWFYPTWNPPLRGMPVRQRVLWALRRTLFRLAPDVSVRLLGGRSLMVLAR